MVKLFKKRPANVMMIRAAVSVIAYIISSSISCIGCRRKEEEEKREGGNPQNSGHY